MTLFTPELFRNFAVGFALGAVALGMVNVDQWSDQVSSPAQAAPPLEAPQPSEDFWSIAE